jgi:signal transduction histidine kinase
MAAVAAAVLMLAVLRVRRDSTTFPFCGLTLAFGAWCAARGLGGLDWPGAALASGLALAAVGGLAPAAAAGFTGGLGAPTALRAWTLVGPAGVVVALAALGPGHPVARLIAGGYGLVGAALGALILARGGGGAADRTSPDAIRLRYLAVAHAIAVVGVGIDTLSAQFGAARIGALLAPLLYLYVGYLHLARVRVADLRQLMGNAVSLSFLAGALAAAFAVLWLSVGPQLGLFVFNAFVASFLLLLLLEPSRSAIQRLVDRRFVASRLELERMLLPLRERLPHSLTLDELLGDLLETVEKIDRLRGSSLFLRDDPQVGFQQVGSVGLPPRRRVNLIRNPDWVAALEADESLLAEELEKDLAGAKNEKDAARAETLLRLMRQLDAQLALPLKTESQLLGFWTLSDERSFEPFSSSELEILRGVADELALAIETTQTFERVRVRDRLASLGEMAAGLAHELRNPLGTIRGALAVLGDPRDAQEREFHAVIVEEIERLDRVVGTFLDYARPDAEPSPIADLGDFVRRYAEGVARAVAEDCVDLVFDIDPEVTAATANAGQLERVICNLVLNAYQAVDGKGTIRVGVRHGESDGELGDCAEIRVEDDGPGMDDTTLDRAAVPFFTTRDEGAGLGLALCERLVRAQGGTLRLLSRPGEGTQAIVQLPAHVEEPEMEQA